MPRAALARLVCLFYGGRVDKGKLDKGELDKVQNYLRRLFGNPEIGLMPRMQRADMAVGDC